MTAAYHRACCARRNAVVAPRPRFRGPDARPRGIGPRSSRPRRPRGAEAPPRRVAAVPLAADLTAAAGGGFRALTATREWEEREFRKHITDWEMERYFEII